MSCRYSRDADDYLTDEGAPCRHDDHGDRTYHCTGKRACSHHIGANEQTCARCVGDARSDLRTIREFAALMPTEAIADGVNSEAANLAGPATDVEAWSWRKIAAKQGGRWHVSLEEEDDDWHPATVLMRAQWNVAMNPAYEPLPEVMTLTNAGDYLERHLHRVAQDPLQDFTQLAKELRKCRAHLEAVLHNSTRAERGAPCPDCGTEEPKVYVRMTRSYGHWCLDPDCERVHYADDTGDRWNCPRNPTHARTVKAYSDYIEERTTA